MPTIKVSHQSSKSAQESFTKVSDLLSNDKELRKLDPKYKCEFDEQSLSGTAKGGKFKADMKVFERSNGSEVQITIDLPLLLTPIKSMVQKTLEKKMSQVLG